MKHVFTYGSLMYTEVWRQIVAQEYQSKVAYLRGYQRYAVVGEHYPAIVPNEKGGDPQCETQGRLYIGVNAQDISALDHFEGEQYRRASVEVILETGEALNAEVYVWRRRFSSRLSSQAWNVEQFENLGLKQFQRQYRGFRT